MTRSVLLLAGGPDAEREVSLNSASEVAQALDASGLDVHHEIIDTPTAAELAAMPGEVVFPVLHGLWGEGGPMQDLLEQDGRPFVGCDASAARLAMDKLATKLVAGSIGVRTPAACLFEPSEPACLIGLPAVLKPTREGSSFGLHICRSEAEWSEAHAAVVDDLASSPGRRYLAERMVPERGTGRELTVAMVDLGEGLDAVGIVEIAPASGIYDLEAKYSRDDTVYTVDPELPEQTKAELVDASRALASAIGVRHLCRVDYRLDTDGTPWMLEVNTMPGFTGASLLPKACAERGIAMPELCALLIDAAVRDAAALIGER